MGKEPLEPLISSATEDILNRDPREVLPLVSRMASNGANRGDIASALGVPLSEFQILVAEVKGFAKALEAGQDYADERVKDALFQRATGFYHPKTKIMQHEGVPIHATYDEYVLPDVGAARFWLTNRQPEQWSEKTTVEVSDYGALLREAAKRGGVSSEEPANG